MTSLSFLRPEAAQRFDDAWVRHALDELRPHVARFARMRRELHEHVGLGAQLSQAALDALACCVLVVAPGGRLRLANAQAEQALRAQTAITLRQGCLSGVTPALAAPLRLGLARAFGQPRQASAFQAAGLQGLVQLRVVPLPELATPVPGPAEPHALVYLADPGALPSHAALRELLGLTRAEAELAALLISGARPEACAAQRQTSMTTVRAQLRSL